MLINNTDLASLGKIYILSLHVALYFHLLLEGDTLYIFILFLSYIFFFKCKEFSLQKS